MNATDTALLAAHNALREQRGLASLRWNAQLENAAQAHANWMASTGTLSHDEPEASFSAREEAAGYDWSKAAENIAEGQTSVAKVMDSWHRSPGHYANITGPYQEAGFGIAVSKAGMKFWCVDFGAK